MIIECTIKWKDSGEESVVNIAIAEEVREETDESICYYCEDSRDYASLFREDSPADFVIIDSEEAPF